MPVKVPPQAAAVQVWPFTAWPHATAQAAASRGAPLVVHPAVAEGPEGLGVLPQKEAAWKCAAAGIGRQQMAHKSKGVHLQQHRTQEVQYMPTLQQTSPDT